MTANFKIENSLDFRWCDKIIVFNYHELNILSNIPVIKDSLLLKIKSPTSVGVWKIKKLK